MAKKKRVTVKELAKFFDAMDAKLKAMEKRLEQLRERVEKGPTNEHTHLW